VKGIGGNDIVAQTLLLWCVMTINHAGTIRGSFQYRNDA
jgi:hypothetical protein